MTSRKSAMTDGVMGKCLMNLQFSKSHSFKLLVRELRRMVKQEMNC